MRKFAAGFLLAVTVLFTLNCLADEDEDKAKIVERVESAGNVLNEVMAAPDKGIPEEILSSAKCVAVVPSLLKGGLGFGAQYGRGVASCRSDKGWSAPAFFVVEGGSFGLQWDVMPKA